MKKNAETQARFKERMRRRGLIQITVWIPAGEKATLRDFVAGLIALCPEKTNNQPTNQQEIEP